MKNQNYPTLEEMLFENRNKEYGAYVLRNTGNQTLLKSLLYGSTILLMISGAIYFANKATPEFNKPTENVITVDFTPINIKDQEIVEPEKEIVVETQEKRIQLNTDQAKHILPDPKKNVIKEETIQNIQELKEKDLGFENRDGDIKSTNNTGGGDVSDKGEKFTTGTQNDDKITESKPKEGIKKPEVINTRNAKVMAVYPGCEKEVGKGNAALTKCMSEKLSRELSSELQDFADFAQSRSINNAVAKMQFIVSSKGEITSVKPISGSQKDLGDASKKALEKINSVLKRKGKTIKPAEAESGQKADLLFTIPVSFQTQ